MITVILGPFWTPVIYTTLAPLIPFEIPMHPGPLNLAVGANQYVISNIQTVQVNHLHNFKKYQLVQRALIQQILEAIEAKFIICLQNRITGNITTEIRTPIAELFATYGKITAKQLTYCHGAVAELTYNISELIDIVFNLVNDLREVGVVEGQTYTDIQMVDLGFLIMSNKAIFRLDNCMWLRCAPISQTW